MRHILYITIAVCLLLTPSLVVAKSPVLPKAHTKLMATGNQAYNKGKYDTARESYIKAIQLVPADSKAYKNLARTYFWQGQYSAALHFYDVYLVNFPKAKDKAQIQQERKLASARISGQPWSLPGVQKKALADLEVALANGLGFARGSGAFHQYEALLRTDYAEPNLIKLREKLSLKLLLEHDELIQTKPQQPTPKLTLEAWNLQHDRLQAASKVASPDLAVTIESRLLLSVAARALLIKNYKDAVTKSKKAIAANPDMLFMRWFLAVAQLQSNDLKDASKTLDLLAPILKKQARGQLSYLNVMRAMVLQKQNQTAQAATLYKNVLKK